MLEVEDEFPLARLSPLLQINHVRQDLLVSLLSLVCSVRFLLVNLPLKTSLVFLEAGVYRRNEFLLDLCDQFEGSLLHIFDLQIRISSLLSDEAEGVVLQSIQAIAKFNVLAPQTFTELPNHQHQSFRAGV